MRSFVLALITSGILVAGAMPSPRKRHRRRIKQRRKEKSKPSQTPRQRKRKSQRLSPRRLLRARSQAAEGSRRR